jgi:hypothetical protein
LEAVITSEFVFLSDVIFTSPPKIFWRSSGEATRPKAPPPGLFMPPPRGELLPDDEPLEPARPLMVVAIFSVHIGNGLFLSNNGYEFGLALLAATVSLAVSGAGKLSADNLLAARLK